MSRPALSKDQEEDIQRLNQMTQQLQALQNQQTQFSNQKSEMTRTLELIKELPEDREIFKQSGQILFKADLAKTIDEMTEKLELLEIRVKKSTTQFTEYQKATQELDQKIRGSLSV